MTQKLEDSGKRRTFSTGAVRDRGDLKPRPDLISPHAQMREGMIMTLGAQKYALRNWEQGLPISECLASAQRHIEQYKRGDTNEDHIAQARWNLGVIIHFEEEVKAGRMDPALDDMPEYANRPDWETDDGRGRIFSVEELHERFGGNDAMIRGVPSTARTATQIFTDREICDLCGEFMGEATTCPACGWRVYDVVEQKAGKVPSTISTATEVVMPPTFYVAGPMRGYENLNFSAFDAARDRGKALGFNIISPADLDREHGINPGKDATKADREPEVFSLADLHRIIRRDVETIMALQPECGDGIAVLNGWGDSTGATAEVALAQWLGLRVVWASDFYSEVE